MFANNSAGRSGSLYINLGGAIDASGPQTVTIAGSQFTGNTAVAADSGFQGAVGRSRVYMSNFVSLNGHLNISNSAFQGNSVVGATGLGGAIDIEVGITVSVTGTSFNRQLGHGRP